MVKPQGALKLASQRNHKSVGGGKPKTRKDEMGQQTGNKGSGWRVAEKLGKAAIPNNKGNHDNSSSIKGCNLPSCASIVHFWH